MKIHLTVALLGLGLSLHAEPPLRLTGSTTVKGALEPRHAVLESAVGRPIEFSGTGSTAGLLSLVGGDCDVAMLSVPLADVARVINQRTPGRVDPSRLRAAHIGDVRTVFIVNPHNSVRKLTADQLSDVLTGKITNWKDVGGANARIEVVSLANGGPLLEHLLRGSPVTAGARTVPNATQIPVLVAQDTNAIGIISAAHPRGQTSVIQTDAVVVAPLFVVTQGEPSPAVQTLIATARHVLDAPN